MITFTFGPFHMNFHVNPFLKRITTTRALTPVWPVAPGVRGWVEEGGTGRTHELAVYALGRRSWPNVFARDTQKTEAVSTGWERAPSKVGV